MLDYSPGLSEWDEPALDEGTDPALERQSWAKRVKATRDHDNALLERIERARTPEGLILLTRVALSDAVADRLEEILEPEDIESDDREHAPEPKLLVASVKSFLKFFLRAADSVDPRFVPGRTYNGELGLQFLDRQLGDLSIRFLGNGRALVAIAAETRRGSCQCLSDELLTDRDLFEISRWLDVIDG
jgi:hypothetical protein